MKTIKKNGRETVFINPCNIRNRRKFEKRKTDFKGRKRVLFNVREGRVYDDVPEFIEGTDIPREISFSKMFKEMRNDFLIGRIKKGEISEDDPDVKRLLEE